MEGMGGCVTKYTADTYTIRPLKWKRFRWYWENGFKAETIFGNMDLSKTTDPEISDDRRWRFEIHLDDRNEIYECFERFKDAKARAEQWYYDQLRLALTKVNR